MPGSDRGWGVGRENSLGNGHCDSCCPGLSNPGDWSHRFPLIVEAAGSLRVRSISIDGEAVVCGDDDVSDFDRLHSQGWDGLGE